MKSNFLYLSCKKKKVRKNGFFPPIKSWTHASAVDGRDGASLGEATSNSSREATLHQNINVFPFVYWKKKKYTEIYSQPFSCKIQNNLDHLATSFKFCYYSHNTWYTTRRKTRNEQPIYPLNEQSANQLSDTLIRLSLSLHFLTTTLGYLRAHPWSNSTKHSHSKSSSINTTTDPPLVRLL